MQQASDRRGAGLEAAARDRAPPTTAATASRLLNGSNVDLAFIDVHMPELSGTEAFWSARKQGIKTFVTLMSNPPAVEAVELAIKLQAYEFLFKPFDTQTTRSPSSRPTTASRRRPRC